MKETDVQYYTATKNHLDKQVGSVSVMQESTYTNTTNLPWSLRDISWQLTPPSVKNGANTVYDNLIQRSESAVIFQFSIYSFTSYAHS